MKIKKFLPLVSMVLVGCASQKNTDKLAREQAEIRQKELMYMLHGEASRECYNPDKIEYILGVLK